MKLIELYKQWMETGKLRDMGLCFSLPVKYNKKLYMFHPNKPEDNLLSRYWAYGERCEETDIVAHKFTPLRQTIVLLICAMCDEL